VRGNKPGKKRKAGKDLPRRRAEHREGKNLYELNNWLKDQGVLSIKELWVHIHYPTTVR